MYILNDSGHLSACPATFPIEQNLKLTNEEGTLLLDPSPYRHLVGHLIYLTITRLDIVYSVNILSQFMHQPRQSHYDAAIRVLHYIKSSIGKGIFSLLIMTSKFMVIQIQIGQATPSLVNPPPTILLHSTIVLSHGEPRSNTLFPSLPLKLNTELQQQLLVNSFGSKCFFSLSSFLTHEALL